MIDFKKWDIVLVNLDPTIVSEIKKTRPCLIISPNAVNKHLKTLVVAPLTSSLRSIPTRLKINFKNIDGEICFDQMRAIDKSRVINIQGKLDLRYRETVNELLMNFFDEL
jgi:mRNA interferase MazF